MYPLQFRPTFRDYLWGGRRLQEVLGKQLPEGPHWAESWEIVDHGADQSIVSNGPLSGTTLGELTRTYGNSLLGPDAPQDRFPLLFKFLDCCQDLSLQVHPDDAGGAKLAPPDRGKTEAWVILDADPGAKLWAGLRQGVQRQDVEQAISDDRLVDLLHVIEPRTGDCIFVPAGVPHALGQGLLVAEIQQASNTTFRLFDWNRVGPDGKPRALHIQQGLDAIDYQQGPRCVQSPQHEGEGAELLVACDKFELRRWSGATPRALGTTDRFQILAVLAGNVDVQDAGSLQKGQTLLNPAECTTPLKPSADAVMLVMNLGG